jgi:hypothetical protein
MDGLTLTIRAEAGFVAVDKPGQRAWVYQAVDGEFRLCTDADPSLINPDFGTRALDQERLQQATANPAMDVVALPGGEGLDGADDVEPKGVDSDG